MRRRRVPRKTCKKVAAQRRVIQYTPPVYFLHQGVAERPVGDETIPSAKQSIHIRMALTVLRSTRGVSVRWNIFLGSGRIRRKNRILYAETATKQHETKFTRKQLSAGSETLLQHSTVEWRRNIMDWKKTQVSGNQQKKITSLVVTLHV